MYVFRSMLAGDEEQRFELSVYQDSVYLSLLSFPVTSIASECSSPGFQVVGSAVRNVSGRPLTMTSP